MRYKSLLMFIFRISILSATLAQAQDLSEVQFKAIKAADNIYMLEGAGGNIGVFFGVDGLFLIDDQFAPLHEKLLAKITEISAGAITGFDDAFLLNTHFHHDHTGGNELIGEAGALIFAHENVRERVAHEHVVPFFKSTNPALKKSGLPVVTFSRDMTLHLNGDSLKITHVENAHTDGDAFVHFTKANVIHTGDLMFKGTYPFYDIDNGGAVVGLISAVEKLISLSDDATIIIPGHGSISNLAELKEYQNMLVTTSDRVRQLIADGKTLEQAQATNPTAEFDEKFNGFISNEAFVGLLYRDLSK